MRVINHVRAEGLVFRANLSWNCDVLETTVRQRHEDIIQVIAEVMDRVRVWSLPELDVNYVSPRWRFFRYDK